ncbi:MAG TPA: endonuclease/exonuclease/phosphatase family protein [Candidatus Bathyarchaeia archaeon]|nr:endonuclease/exonuclease/phosphatase family protein [Candidatus Bathyarchaeia archaeon]
MVPMILLTISLILTLAGFLSAHAWIFDLAAHFRLQYLVLQVLCITLFIFKKRWGWLSVTLFAVFLNMLVILPLFMPSPQNQTPTHHSKKISILLINLNSSNNEFSKVAQCIQQKNPDILALEEINSKWLSHLDSILKQYPYHTALPREDNFGIGLYSKIPADDMKIVYFGPVEIPSIIAQYNFGQPATILFTHPVPPGSLKYYKWRNEQLKDIASNRHQFNPSFINVGDLNTTSWSYHFQRFAKAMGLRDTRKGFGTKMTWPAMLPIMGITIDHVLVSPNITVLDHKVGPDIGSDHYPVFVELEINNNP